MQFFFFCLRWRCCQSPRGGVVRSLSLAQQPVLLFLFTCDFAQLLLPPPPSPVLPDVRSIVLAASLKESLPEANPSIHHPPRQTTFCSARLLTALNACV
jgi:hypothetical protein